MSEIGDIAEPSLNRQTPCEDRGTHSGAGK